MCFSISMINRGNVNFSSPNDYFDTHTAHTHTKKEKTGKKNLRGHLLSGIIEDCSPCSQKQLDIVVKGC